MNSNISEIIQKIVDFCPNKIIFSNPRTKDVKYKKICVIEKEISNKKMFQVEQYTEKQVFHENILPENLTTTLDKFIKTGYKQINIFSKDGEMEIKLNKSLNAFISEKQYSSPRISKAASANNRNKNYILSEGMDIPLFRELGIFTENNKVVASKYDKFKQINRFTEFIDDVLKNYYKEEINIIDFGCGKSYLTFFVYYYLTNIKKIKANIIGLDLKTDVIKKCDQLARKYDYSGLTFEVGDINGYNAPFDVNMVITLHACDTATDYALYNAISWDADIIMSVPCCQHEVNKQIESDCLMAITKYGIVKERVSALITDAIRGCVLEYSGYKTDLMEFIDIEHSPKNIMIRAVKRNVSKEKRAKSYLEAENLIKEFGLSQTLFNLVSRKGKEDET